MSRLEEVHVKNTKRFIQERGVAAAVERYEFVRSTAGGKIRGARVPVETQFLRLISTGILPARIDENGEQVKPSFAITAMPSADLELFDKLTIGDMRLKVVHVDRMPEWRTHAEAFQYA